ncbi:MAG: hypothetical protein OEY11_05365 [Gammaproteobacteria bacterium]|nr:hypothetical protein [Gammaproteobacteria bacterium]
MNSSTALYAVVISIAILLTVLLSFFVSFPVSLVMAFIVAIAFYFIMKKSEAEHEDEAETPLSANDLAVESLLAVNLDLRKTIIAAEIRASFEAIIDQLLEILPVVAELDPDSELAWVINRMATEYLPEKSIRPYLALDEGSRHDEKTISSVRQGLAGMKKELDDVEEILASRKSNEFNAKAKFLKHRFDI